MFSVDLRALYHIAETQLTLSNGSGEGNVETDRHRPDFTSHAFSLPSPGERCGNDDFAPYLVVYDTSELFDFGCTRHNLKYYYRTDLYLSVPRD